jgi:hypothetical protein
MRIPAAWGSLLIICWLPASAQQVFCKLAPDAEAYSAAADQRPTPDALELTEKANQALKNICQSNCPQMVLYRNSTAPALLLASEGGRAKIVYSPRAFSVTYDRYGDAGIVGLLAHVMGHALDDAIGASWVDQTAPAEQRADSWAGCILAQAGLSASERETALAALSEHPPALISKPGSPTNWNLRLAAMRSGYSHCGGSGPLDAPSARVK